MPWLANALQNQLHEFLFTYSTGEGGLHFILEILHNINEKQTCLLWMKNENRAGLNVPNNYNMDFFTFQLHSDRHFIEMFISFSFFLTWKSVFEDWNILLPLLIRRDHWILFFIFWGIIHAITILHEQASYPLISHPLFFFFTKPLWSL